MATMTGADADALDRAAHELHRAAEQLRSGRTRVERPLYSAPWHGRGADAFRQEWSSSRQAEILAAAAFLDSAVTVLRRNAEEQRRASSSGEGSSRQSPGGSDTKAELPPELEELRHKLELLGLSISQIKAALDLMLRLAETPGFDLGPFLSTIENLGHIADISNVVGMAGTGLDIVGYVMDFFDGAAKYSNLPFDEMMIAATVTMGVAVAMDAGKKVAGDLVGKGVAAFLLSTGVGAPAAPLAGFVASKVASHFAGEGLDYMDEHFDISGNAAESALEVYRYTKTHDLGDMVVDGLRNTGEAMLDTAADLGDKLTFWD